MNRSNASGGLELKIQWRCSVNADVRRRMQMSNPYASPNTAPNLDDSCKFDRSVKRGAFFGLCGYFAPFLIVVLMLCLRFGIHPIEQMDEVYAGLAGWHWPINLIGCLLLIPNYACLLTFGVAGYKREGLIRRMGLNSDGISLGVATLIGYFAMLVVHFMFDPFRYWSAELTAVTQSLVALLFPIALMLYCTLIRTISPIGESRMAIRDEP